MALTRGTARRTAEACFQIAERDGSMETWLAAFAVLEERLGRPEVMRLLASPAVPAPDRVAVLDRVLGQDVTGAPRNLAALLVRRNRIDVLPAVAREFRRLHAIREGIVGAVVTSAVPLDAEQASALHERLTAMTGRRVDLQQRLDPALLAGISVRLGDRLIDGSVRGRLERLRATFSDSAL